MWSNKSPGTTGYSLLLLVAALTFGLSMTASGAAVNYHGSLIDTVDSPLGDFVIAGTFRPGFDVSRYNYSYGDSAGNMGTAQYGRAVADGNFRPIGDGTNADGDGAFSGNGTVSGIDNLPIYLFLFSKPDPEQAYNVALATSTSPPWVVQNDQDLSIDAATANVFEFGRKNGDSIMLLILPFPEPSSAIVALGASAILIMRRRRHPH